MNFLSTASTIELARLCDTKQVKFVMPISDWIVRSLSQLKARTLPITHDVAIEAYQLIPPFHKDPVDRLLVAAARIESCHLMTADHLLLNYPHLRSIDARM
jgi:PIN domain nuclease of toxin-antitoxin system